MDTTFNEISFQPYLHSAEKLTESFLVLVRTYNYLRKEYSIQHLIFPYDLSRIEVLPGTTFYQWIDRLNGKNKQIILSIIKKPFSDDILLPADANPDRYSFENAQLRIPETFCIGLGFAHIIDSLSISLNTDPFWLRNIIELLETNAESLEVSVVEARNISDQNNINEELEQFLEGNRNIILKETQLDPLQKERHLRDDHGIDTLIDFANRILRSSFVISVINSLPFNPNTSRFIRRIFPDGRIEIVLHWEDEGYGMVIQTTGSNLQETSAIAEILRDTFDH